LQLPQAYIICSLFDKVGDKVITFENRHAKPLLAIEGFYGLHLPGEPQFSYLGLR